MRLIVFTDLDGTLLDHHTYGYAEARPALERIRSEGWPLVFVTSKTRAEVEGLRAETGVDEPFVVENGGGIFFPACRRHLAPAAAVPAGPHALVQLGLPYADIRAFVEEEGRELGVVGFGDMADADIGGLTGLEGQAAAQARAREFTEPFRLEEGARLAPIEAAARRRGIHVTTGGRLHHLMGADQDKGRAVGVVRDAFAAHWGVEPVTIALGDGPNDMPMLYSVDHPVVMPPPGRPPLHLERADVRVAPVPGPAGWAAALLDLFDHLIASPDA